MSSPAWLDLGERCETFMNVHLNSSWLWGIRPHSEFLFAFSGHIHENGCLFVQIFKE